MGLLEKVEAARVRFQLHCSPTRATEYGNARLDLKAHEAVHWFTNAAMQDLILRARDLAKFERPIT